MSAWVLAGVIVTGAWTQLDAIGLAGWLALVVLFVLDRYAGTSWRSRRLTPPAARPLLIPLFAAAAIAARPPGATSRITAREEFGFSGDEGYHLSATRAFACISCAPARSWLGRSRSSACFGQTIPLCRDGGHGLLLASSYFLPASALFGRYPAGFYLLATPLNVAFEAANIPVPASPPITSSTRCRCRRGCSCFGRSSSAAGRTGGCCRWRCSCISRRRRSSTWAVACSSRGRWCSCCSRSRRSSRSSRSSVDGGAARRDRDVLQGDGDPAAAGRVAAGVRRVARLSARRFAEAAWPLARRRWRRFCIYYAVRRGARIERVLRSGRSRGHVDDGTSRRVDHQCGCAAGCGGIVAIVAAIAWSVRKTNLIWIATALALALFFFADAASIPYTGYGRFRGLFADRGMRCRVCECVSIARAAQDADGVERARRRAAAPRRDVRCSRWVFRPDYERNSLEWNRSLIRFPVRTLAEKIASTREAESRCAASA